VRRLGGPLGLLAVWWGLCAGGILDERTMASPGDVFSTARDMLGTGELQHHLVTSLGRVGQGLAIGVTAGVVFATISGLFRLGDDLLDSALQMLRSVPVIGMLPLVMIWFGIGEEPKVLLIAIGTTFPIYVNTLAAIRGVDAKLVEAGRTFGLGRLGLARRVILPGAVPGFLVGLRFALVGAWLILIFAEQINARSGLGYLLSLGRSTYRIDIIILALVIYGVLGFIADALVRLLERSLLSWRRGFGGT
jgi:sulfonate transport system permease protein